MSAVVQPGGEFRQINPGQLSFSKSTAQAERRRHFDKPSLLELVASVKEKGIIQPIVVRPVDDSKQPFEVVAGERRVIAALEAGLDQIPAMVHALTDEQALDLQLIENLQREGLHPLVECEGYEDLKKRGHTIEQIAERVGKSTSYIYKRLELEKCGKKVRAAFYNGTLDASKALLLSRLPEQLQDKALKEVTGGWRAESPMSYREMFSYVQREFWLRLDQAPFKTEDAQLVAAAGACGKCPKNTAAQLGLLGDVSKDALCLDKACFQSKIAAAAAQAVAAAQAAGQVVLQGKKAKEALSYNSDEYITLDRHEYKDAKNRTYGQLLGKEAAKITAIAVEPDTGKAIAVVKKSDAMKVLRDKGIKLKSSSSSFSAPRPGAKQIEKEKAEQAKRDAELKLFTAIIKGIHEKAPKPLDQDEHAQLLEFISERIGTAEILDAIFGDGKTPDALKLNPAGLLRALRTYLLCERFDNDDTKVILATAKRHGVNVEKIKAELAPKPAPAAATPAKKKAAKKK